MRRRRKLLTGCSEEDHSDRGFRESQGGILCPSGGGLKIGRLPSPSGWLIAVDVCPPALRGIDKLWKEM